MEIKLTFESSVNGKLEIDGKEMDIIFQDGVVKLKELDKESMDNTLGRIFAGELFSKLVDIMQAWAVADEIDFECGTWDILSDEAADEAWNKAQ